MKSPVNKKQNSVFRKSRSRIILLTMLFLILCQVVEISSIYISTYISVTQDQQDRLLQFTEKYGFGDEILTIPPDLESAENAGMEGISDSGTNSREPSLEEGTAEIRGPQWEFNEDKQVTMYMVKFDGNGEVLRLYNNLNPVMDDQSFIEAAKGLISRGKTHGNYRNLIYRITEGSEGIVIVTMMDSTILNESYRTLIRNMILVSLTMILLFLFTVTYFSGKIVAPMEENDRKQKQFISDAGHELKTPIAVMQTSLDMLIREEGESKWTQNIQYELKRMKDLVIQLLDLARYENQDVKLMPINLSRLVWGEVLPMESFAFEKRCLIEEEIEDNIQISGEEGRLKQLVSILLENAVSHANDGKLKKSEEEKSADFGNNDFAMIKISLKKSRKNVFLSVSNPGGNIKDEDIPYLFERFYRRDDSRTADGHYGLGLAIAKAITESHGGSISAENQEGTTRFLCTFPLTS